MSSGFIDLESRLPSEALVAEAAEFQSRLFLEALVAALAIMAHADGEIAATERRRIFALVRESARPLVYSEAEIVEEVAMHEANYRLDPEIAHLLARERLVQMEGHRRLGYRIVAACRRMIPADGVLHPAEFRALAEVRRLLGIQAAGESDPSPGR